MDAICVGTLAVDVFIRKAATADTSLGPVTFLSAAELHPGGTACNTCLDLAKLGVPVGVITRVGRDAGGQLVTRCLVDCGVDVTGLCTDQEVQTTLTVFSADENGQMSYLYYPGTSATFCEDDVDLGLVGAARFLHMGGTFLMPRLDGEPTARVLAAAKGHGVVTSLDPTPNLTPESLSLLSPSLPHLDYFLPNIAQAQFLSGCQDLPGMAGFFLERGVGTVAIKMDRRGCYIMTRDLGVHVPSYMVQEVEPTGAGDAFVAGFLTGLWLGWDLERTARLANAVGAMCVQAVGAQGGLGCLDETLAFMQSHAG